MRKRSFAAPAARRLTWRLTRRLTRPLAPATVGCFLLPGGRLSNRAYCLHFSEHTGAETLNSAKNWLKTRIILEKQFAKWYRTIWPCRGLRHRGTPHGRGDQQGDTKPRGSLRGRMYSARARFAGGKGSRETDIRPPGAFFCAAFRFS